ncbi:2,3-dihydro-2,3-dihydroxybenzoate dehydrogenase [Streptomyces sp. NPDC048272]|uniref:2,3-dihydro-2,3-dihydroxybenzoate dehydrogenase n=1 Tax=Streptomyces sp. NPDC048272 TaxID=3154616 RepID=UPI00343C1D4C
MEGTTALVTGAAGGIGREVALALGRRGVFVAAVDRDPVALGRAVEEWVDHGVKAVAFPTDVTSSAEVERTVAAAESELGPIEHLVNAAGILRLGQARAFTDEDWNATFAVNATGVFHVSRAVVNRMAERGRGSLVTVASNAAGTPRTDMAAYAASKAAATMFTKSLGLEVARHGIRCNVVAPGSTDTPMLRSMWHDESGPRGSIEGHGDSYRVGIPLGRLAQPRHIADAVVFLLSDEAAHITLHTLTVDGGATLGV